MSIAMFSHFFIVSLFFTAGFAFSIDDCPSSIKFDWYLKVFGNSCYRFELDKAKTFQDAQNYCHRHGGNLATVKNGATDKFLQNTLKFVFDTDNVQIIWIGLRFEQTYDRYYWVDGTLMNYTKLDPTTGHMLTLDCVAMVTSSGTNHWSNFQCGSNGSILKFPFICEYPIKRSITKAPTIQPHHGPITIDECPSDLRKKGKVAVYGSKCYGFFTSYRYYKTFDSAQRFCKQTGGNLAMVESNDTNSFILDELKKMKDGSNRAYFRDTWIGLRYVSTYGSFEWMDGSLLTFVNFKQQKWGSNYECVAMSPSDGLWVARHCEGYYTDGAVEVYLPFVCEYLPTPKEHFVTATPPVVTTTTTVKTTTPSLHVKHPSSNKDIAKECPVEDEDKKNIQVLDDSCFYFGINQTLSFTEAEIFCERYGGTLALVESKLINNFLHKHLTQTHNLKFYRDPVWIGLHYNTIRGAFYWMDGSVMEFSNFNLDGHFGECVSMSPWDGSWRQEECHKNSVLVKSHTRNFICEFQMRNNTESNPTPVTTKTRTSITTTTTTTETPKKCPTIVCTLDCGMDGYRKDEINGCMLCLCDN